MRAFTFHCFFWPLQIKNKIDRRTNKVVEENPKNVKTGDACDVILKPMRPLVVETFKAYPPLGRFAVRDMRMTVAVGVINSTVRKIPEVKGKAK
jgi:elongation factor 1-alpha